MFSILYDHSYFLFLYSFTPIPLKGNHLCTYYLPINLEENTWNWRFELEEIQHWFLFCPSQVLVVCSRQSAQAWSPLSASPRSLTRLGPSNLCQLLKPFFITIYPKQHVFLHPKLSAPNASSKTDGQGIYVKQVISAHINGEI